LSRVSSAGDFDPRSYYEMSTEEIKKVIDIIKGKILSVWIGVVSIHYEEI